MESCCGFRALLSSGESDTMTPRLSIGIFHTEISVADALYGHLASHHDLTVYLWREKPQNPRRGTPQLTHIWEVPSYGVYLNFVEAGIPHPNLNLYFYHRELEDHNAAHLHDIPQARQVVIWDRGARRRGYAGYTWARIPYSQPDDFSNQPYPLLHSWRQTIDELVARR